MSLYLKYHTMKAKRETEVKEAHGLPNMVKEAHG
jgi:hypothetical protein